MVALVAAYAVLWLGVSLYVAWLAIRQNQLAARLEALASEIGQRMPRKGSIAHAA